MKRTMIVALALGLLPLVGTIAGARERADRKERLEQFNKRFGDADVNSDAQLTRDEAEARMPGVAARFDEMDSGKKGYVTKQDIARALKNARGNRKTES